MTRTMRFHHGTPNHRGGSAEYRIVSPHMVRWTYRLMRREGIDASAARMIVCVLLNQPLNVLVAP